jgi:uroporphyrin-III C-methyltransferase
MADTHIPSPNTPSTKRGIGLMLCTFVIVIALVSGLAWQYWQQQQWQAKLLQTQQQLHRLSNQLDHNAQHRALLTAKHTVQLADYQRRYHHDAKATDALIQLAASQIDPAQFPALQGVHSALQHDSIAMQAHSAQNPATWLMRLDALKNTVTQLQQIPDKLSPKTTPKTTPAATTTHASFWHRLWQRTTQTFAHMVVLRRVDHAIVPMLDGNDLATLQNNLLLTLSQAQWAIMNHQAKLYQQSITSATQMLHHFASNDPNTEAFAKQLASLAHAPVDARLPDLDTSFSAIDRALGNDQTPTATTIPASSPPASSPSKVAQRDDATPNQPATPAKATP